EGATMEAVVKAVQGLGEQEQRVLELRFGLDGAGARSLRAAGDVMGVSAERVRQIEQRALARLRESEDLRSAAA
ncbi:MAG TPA: sigma factor-like helix-turn-helix DNA-binding protein, partial [Actinomycetota bacterium]